MDKKVGRPKKEIDQDNFEKLCAMQCTKDEMCNFFECDEKTITRWCKETYDMGFAEIFKAKSAVGLISLRRAQFKLADKNPSMAIFLGKQYLGQRDRYPEELDYGEIGSAIVNIASLINNPENDRSEKDFGSK